MAALRLTFTQGAGRRRRRWHPFHELLVLLADAATGVESAPRHVLRTA